MKGNVESLVKLAEMVEHQEDIKKDYLVPTNKMSMVEDNKISIMGTGYFDITDVAHQQISERLNIPKRYYDNMAVIPGLRTHNVNEWFKHRQENRLVRTLENNARAFLSDRYRPIDNFMILGAFLPSIKDMEVKVKSTSLTEQKMYIQVTFPEIKGDVVPGDTVQAGIILTNSEVGLGAVDISTVVWRLVCDNGMIGESLLNKYHVGRRVGENISDYDFFKDDTIQAELESFRLRLRDTLAKVVSETYFQDQLARMRRASKDIIEDVPQTIKNVTKRFNLPEFDQMRIVQRMTEHRTTAEDTRWSLANGITALAHQIENPDSQYQYEKIGNDIIELKPHEWEVLSA